ncbi:MAG: zinc ABC transporter substrate-binding protein [Leptothrix sp. (in: Bacteria)]|nr:zinc ABC transporter substrate-binding protein [Leptothrix sp. (in: b-proteobacteria)]
MRTDDPQGPGDARPGPPRGRQKAWGGPALSGDDPPGPGDAHPQRWRGALALVAALGLAAGFSAPAAAFTVFACEPEWAALTRELLPQARLHVATHARQDPHHIEARPALIAQLRSADLAVCTGAGLEEGWLPMLQQRAGNPRVQEGAPGLLLAAEQVKLIDARPGQLRQPFAGDIHPEGNPHVHADPHRLLEVARALARRLAQLEPAEAAAIDGRFNAFERDWRRRIADWERRAAPLKGRAVVVQHASFAYLWNWLGLRPLADLEPKPGLAPSPGHLQSLLTTLRAQPSQAVPAVVAVVVAQHQDARAGRWLVDQLGTALPLLQLPATVTDEAAADALGRWYEQLLQALLSSVPPGPGPASPAAGPAASNPGR